MHSPVSYTAPVIVNLSDGSYTLYAYANDTYGNRGSTSVSFTVDTTGVFSGSVGNSTGSGIANANVSVVGTGYSGLIKVSDEAKAHLDKQGIRLVIEKTSDAARTFNKLAESGEKVVATLHLTC